MHEYGDERMLIRFLGSYLGKVIDSVGNVWVEGDVHDVPTEVAESLIAGGQFAAVDNSESDETESEAN